MEAVEAMRMLNSSPGGSMRSAADPAKERDAISCILYVVSAQSLTTPYTPWEQSKLTKRFKEFFDELMPNELDQIVAHGNFEEAFDIRQGERTARACAGNS